MQLAVAVAHTSTAYPMNKVVLGVIFVLQFA